MITRRISVLSGLLLLPKSLERQRTMRQEPVERAWPVSSEHEPGPCDSCASLPRRDRCHLVPTSDAPPSGAWAYEARRSVWRASRVWIQSASSVILVLRFFKLDQLGHVGVSRYAGQKWRCSWYRNVPMGYILEVQASRKWGGVYGTPAKSGDVHGTLWRHKQ